MNPRLNPRTVEELLEMPTSDIDAISDDELRAWCMPFWPHTRPIAVVTTALTREVTATATGIGDEIQERIKRIKAERAAASSGGAVTTGGAGILSKLRTNNK